MVEVLLFSDDSDITPDLFQESGNPTVREQRQENWVRHVEEQRNSGGVINRLNSKDDEEERPESAKPLADKTSVEEAIDTEKQRAGNMIRSVDKQENDEDGDKGVDSKFKNEEPSEKENSDDKEEETSDEKAIVSCPPRRNPATQQQSGARLSSASSAASTSSKKRFSTLFNALKAPINTIAGHIQRRRNSHTNRNETSSCGSSSGGQHEQCRNPVTAPINTVADQARNHGRARSEARTQATSSRHSRERSPQMRRFDIVFHASSIQDRQVFHRRSASEYNRPINALNRFINRRLASLRQREARITSLLTEGEIVRQNRDARRNGTYFVSEEEQREREILRVNDPVAYAKRVHRPGQVRSWMTEDERRKDRIDYYAAVDYYEKGNTEGKPVPVWGDPRERWAGLSNIAEIREDYEYTLEREQMEEDYKLAVQIREDQRQERRDKVCDRTRRILEARERQRRLENEHLARREHRRRELQERRNQLRSRSEEIIAKSVYADITKLFPSPTQEERRRHEGTVRYTDEYGPCTLCFETKMFDAIGCRSCKNPVACGNCIRRWNHSRNRSGRQITCPLCRAWWPNEYTSMRTMKAEGLWAPAE